MNENIKNSISSMKMYYFTIGGYASEYHVMAKSKSEALSWLRIYCEKLDAAHARDYWTKEWDVFNDNHDLIHELDEGVVIRTEVS